MEGKPRVFQDKANEKTYQVERQITETAFATIYLVTGEDGNEYACKTYARESLQKRKYFEILGREIAILRGIKHRNIMEPSAIFKDFDNYYILTPYCVDGSLADLVRARGRLTEEEIQLLVFELLKALECLRTEEIIHRDIKPQNVLLKRVFPGDAEIYQELRACVIDFGLSYQFPKSDSELKRFTFCGSPNTLAPEVILSHIAKRLREKCEIDSSLDAECVEVAKMVIERQTLIRDKYRRYDAMESGYKYEVDMWGLGCTMYFLMYGEMPFRASKNGVLLQKILRGDYMINTSLNPTLSQDCINYVEKLLQANRNDRYTLEEALDADWISHGAMVKLRYLPHECIRRDFEAKKFYAAQPDIYQFEETLLHRIALQRAHKIQKPIFMPTLDIGDAIKGLGLLKIKMKSNKMSARAYPYENRVSIVQYLIKNCHSFVFDGVAHKLPNPIKFPPVLLENRLFHKHSFNEFVNSLDNIGRKTIQNYLMYRSDIVRNAFFENDLSTLPNVVFDPQLVVAVTNSEHYGSAYLFQDGSFSFCFTDNTIVTISSNNAYIDYYGFAPEDMSGAIKISPTAEYFRVKSEHFAAFFGKEKESIANYFKDCLKEKLRTERAVKPPEVTPNLQECEVSTSNSEMSKTEDNKAAQQPPSFNEIESTVDIFLAPYLDILYDDTCRCFHKDVSPQNIDEFAQLRRKALAKGKEEANSDNYEISLSYPNLIVVSAEKVLNLALEDIVATVIENEHAHFGNDTLISHIASGIDLNNICLDILQKPMPCVNSEVQKDGKMAFRLNTGEFEVNEGSTSVLVAENHITFRNEADDSLSYPVQYFRNEGFRFEVGTDKINEAVELSSEFHI